MMNEIEEKEIKKLVSNLLNKSITRYHKYEILKKYINLPVITRRFINNFADETGINRKYLEFIVLYDKIPRNLYFDLILLGMTEKDIDNFLEDYKYLHKDEIEKALQQQISSFLDFELKKTYNKLAFYERNLNKFNISPETGNVAFKAHDQLNRLRMKIDNKINKKSIY